MFKAMLTANQTLESANFLARRESFSAWVGDKTLHNESISRKLVSSVV